MAHQQVHRSRWIACRRRSAAPSITILVFSRGKTVEKCAVGRPPGFLLIPSRIMRESSEMRKDPPVVESRASRQTSPRPHRRRLYASDDDRDPASKVASEE